ncbi:MAG: winged helix-turn-helix domain-containing protein [Anaerolineae bacterium]
MSRILLCQAPDTQLPQLEAALAKKEHDVVGVLDLTDLDNLVQVEALKPVDLAIVDASSALDGTASCHAFHESYPNIPMLLLIAEEEQIGAETRDLTRGNVLRMPFTPRKVTNRVERVITRPHSTILTVGDLTLDMDKRCVARGDIVRRLTPRQAQLLEVLMRNAGHTLTRKYLMETVWETDYMGDTRTLDVHVRWIRERIEEHPSSPRYLRTVRGVGYHFDVPTEE